MPLATDLRVCNETVYLDEIDSIPDTFHDFV